MTVWNRIEQYFKNHGMRALERVLGLSQIPLCEFDASSVKRILIVRPHDQLGDFLLSTPVFRALRAHFPDAYIAVVARSYTATVARNNRYLNQVIPFYETGYGWRLGSVLHFVRCVRSGFDLAIVLNTVSHSLSSDLIAYFSRAKYILGSDHHRFPATRRNFFYNLIAPYDKGEKHQTERNLDIVRAIGVDTADRTENMDLAENELEWAKRYLLEQGVTVEKEVLFIHPGAGKLDNRWPAVNFAKTANYIANTFGLSIVISWGPNEAETGQAVIRGLEQKPVVVSNLSLRRLAALIAVAKLFLCNDTGVMHIGAAVGTPLVAIFGPTDPAQWKPIGEKFVAVRGHDYRCESVRVKDVITAAEQLLYDKI